MYNNMGIRMQLTRLLIDKFNMRVELERVKQGAVLPCFYIEFRDVRINKIAYIEYSKTYTYDICYYTDELRNETIEDVVAKLDTITEVTGYKIINGDVEADNKSIRYTIDVVVPIEIKALETADNETYQLIMDNLKEITGLKVYYQQGDLKELENSFFVIEPSTTRTVNISINGKKEKEREIVIRYVFIDVNKDTSSYLESTMDKLINRIKGHNGIYSSNYDIDINYNKEEYQELSIINHEITLELKERSN